MPAVKLLNANQPLLLVGGKPTIIPPQLQTEIERVATEFFSTSAMKPPNRLDLPFFAYGLFKPGQLGFDGIRELAQEVDLGARMQGVLFERDGVPLLLDSSDGETGEVAGALVTFHPDGAAAAYQKIAALEPERQYEWGTRRTAGGMEANVLISISSKGAHRIEETDWDGRKDPHFKEALAVVECVLSKGKYEMGSVERLMELQMAYMLLWTAIERYTSLRYHLRTNVMGKLRQMATEPGFQDALKRYVSSERSVYSTDAGEPEKLSGEKPKKALLYYYQVRSNVAHRGKALMIDACLLENCIGELLPIFRATIDRAFEGCKYNATMPPR